MCKKDEITKLSNEQTENLIKDIQESNLSERNKKLIGKIVGTVGWLCGVIDNQSMSIRKLKDWIFGAKTEKTKKIIKDDKDSHDDPDNNKNQKNSGSKKKRKGHGKNGADKYSNAPEIFYTDNKRNSGDRCSGCEKGNLYNLKPGTQLRFLGQAPLVAVIYRPQKLRCSSCGKVFTSDIPTDAGDTRSNGSANSMVALLKYGTGIPFYRLENLQNCLNIPIPASTQWDMVEKVADAIQPVHEKLMDFAAQSELIYVDDTGAKVLSIMKEIEKERKLNKKTRTGIFTTGMVAIKNNHQVNLFFTGRKHAGENLESLLRKRKSGLSPPIIMSDGLSRNNPKKTEIRHINCLVHSRRMYVDCHNSFPEETAYVITQLGLVYKNDCFCKDNNLKNNERLAYHQKNSCTIMKGIKEYISNKMKNKDIEPNSDLGNACRYMLKRWDKLTDFLITPGAPLDNNICERLLKTAILHRKNSMFFKNELGAQVSDILMSVIRTTISAGKNPFEYLTVIQKYKYTVFKNPSEWLPWNYEKTLELLKTSSVSIKKSA